MRILCFALYVGETGFEPATPWSQTKCANRTALHPELNYGCKDRVIFVKLKILVKLYRFDWRDFRQNKCGDKE